MGLVSCLRAFRQQWVIWTVLFFSTGMKALVNQVEGPFARSLIACEKPLAYGEYSGSRWCGDRLSVIQGGMEIQAVGQGQENFAMLCSLTFVVVVTGIWGPRVALVLGLSGVTLSVMLFVAATGLPSSARGLYAMGQGLQGVYPIEYLLGILMFHTSIQPGVDGQATFELGGYMGLLNQFVWNVGIGTLVSMMELTDYRPVWLVILAMNVTILIMVIVGFPEMKPIDSEKFDDVGPFTKVYKEVASYMDLVSDYRARRYLSKQLFENLIPQYFNMCAAPSMMAYHGFHQAHASWVMFLGQVLGMLCMPLYPKALERWGHLFIYSWTSRLNLTFAAVTALLTPLDWRPFAAFSAWNSVTSGFGAFKGFVDSRFAEPEQMTRFQSAQWIMGYFEGMWTGPAYSQVFDAVSPDYYHRVQAPLLCCVGVGLVYFVVFFLLYDIDGIQGIACTCRVIDQGGAQTERLWNLVQGQEGYIDHGKWELFHLGEVLEVDWSQVSWEGLAIVNVDHFKGIVMSMNSTPKAGADLLRKLQNGIDLALHIHAEHAKLREELQEPEPEKPKPANVSGWYDVFTGDNGGFRLGGSFHKQEGESLEIFSTVIDWKDGQPNGTKDIHYVGNIVGMLATMTEAGKEDWFIGTVAEDGRTIVWVGGLKSVPRKLEDLDKESRREEAGDGGGEEEAGASSAAAAREEAEEELLGQGAEEGNEKEPAPVAAAAKEEERAKEGADEGSEKEPAPAATAAKEEEKAKEGADEGSEKEPAPAAAAEEKEEAEEGRGKKPAPAAAAKEEEAAEEEPEKENGAAALAEAEAAARAVAGGAAEPAPEGKKEA